MNPLVPVPNVSSAAADAKLDDPELNRLAVTVLGQLPDWVELFAARVQALQPAPGSRFEDDDEMKPTEPPSEQVAGLLRSAIDHLAALADAVRSGGPRPLAAFTLIRSAIEASAIAAWLMLPGTKDKRLKNSIRLSVENRKDTETFIKNWDTGGEVSEWFIEEMTATKNQRGGTSDMDLNRNFPTITSILQETDKQQRWSALAGLDAWRACSGIAHSNMQFAGASMTEVKNGEMIDVMVRPSTLMMMLLPAQQYFEFSVELAEKHFAAPPSRVRTR